jgi:hypothetical protein
MPMWKRFARMLDNLRLLPPAIRHAVTLGPRYPSDKERLIVATMKSESIRRELANRAAAAHEHEERQQLAYWQLWRSIRPSAGEAIPPEILDQAVPDHVTLALSVVGDYDDARVQPGAFSDCLYRPVSDLPYPHSAIRRSCEFLIGIADGDHASFGDDHEQLVNERDMLGLALFSLDYFLDVPASEIPRQKLENLALEHRYVPRSRQPAKPSAGDVVIRHGSDVTEYVNEVIGVADNDEWMIVTSSGASVQVVRNAGLGKWEEVKVITPAEASWLTLTPSGGTPTWDPK